MSQKYSSDITKPHIFLIKDQGGVPDFPRLSIQPPLEINYNYVLDLMLVFFCNTLKNKRTSLTAEGISWILYIDDQFSSVQFSRSVMSDFVTPWNAALQASLSITSSWNLLKLMSIESVMPSNHLILCRPFLLLPSVFPSIKVFSNESVLHIR